MYIINDTSYITSYFNDYIINEEDDFIMSLDNLEKIAF